MSGATKVINEPSVGVRLRTYRVACQLSQEALASKANVATLTVSRIETGIGKPRLSTARKLAAALGCSVGDLLDQAEDDPANKEKAPPGGRASQAVPAEVAASDVPKT